MRQLRTILCAVMSVGIIVQSTQAEIVINEAMVNEPGGTTSLEWIELYNDGQFKLTRAYRLVIGSDTIGLPDTLAEREYFIICRRLFNGGFESEWGNGSGVWGDNEY